MKAKTKTKKNVRKFGRHKFDAKDPPIVETPSCDLSALGKPIDTSLSSLRHVTKLFETGSEEVKCILAYECEMVYECRICRSLFRSLVNFISHKRIYCPEKFSITTDKSATNPPEMIFEKTIDSESKENCKIERELRSNVATKQRSKKDLSSIVTMLQKKISDPEYDEVTEKNHRMRIIADTEQVLLEVLESNGAAFQTVLEPKVLNIDTEDLMKAQTTELRNILSRDTAILGPDGYVLELSSDEKCDNPLQVIEENKPSILNDLKSNTSLICSLCDTKFATKKTLTFHMKSLHTPNRMVYPCPCCDNFFPSTWGVYRHLVKVHRKSNAQVRKLRSEIQAKAYRKETTRAQDIEKARAVRKPNNLNDCRSLTDETQEWMAHLESDVELQRCGGCGKRFDRKAALLAHSQICQRRLAACNDVALKSKRNKSVPEVVVETRNPSPVTVTTVPNVENESISPKEVQSPPLTPVESLPSSSSSTKTSNNPVMNLPIISPAITITRLSQEPPAEISIRVEGVASLSKDAWDKIGTESPNVVTNGHVEANRNDVNAEDTSCDTMPVENSNSELSDDPEIIFTKIEKTKNIPVNNSGGRKRKLGKRDVTTAPNKRTNSVSIQEVPAKSPSLQPETSEVTEQEHRIATIENLRKLQCGPCNRKFSSLTYLRRHMAGHINWYRYHCKMCDYKCFDKVDFIAHCNKIHNAKNNRTNIANMMAETMPDDGTTESPRMILRKHIPPSDSLDLEVIDVIKPADEVHNAVNDKVDVECVQNGETRPPKTTKKSNGIDGSYCSDSDDDTPDETNELTKNARLDEDPELRRMVMEVIFGSSETVANEKSDSNSSNDQSELGDNPENSEDQSNSSSSSDSGFNSNNITIRVGKATESTKNDNRHTRAARNRTKLEDKDFIYDLDAVLLKERVQENLRTIKITNSNETNAVDKSKCKNKDDLSVIMCKDDVVELGKVEKVA